MSKSKVMNRLKQRAEAVKKAPHVIVEALAGTGKTTTLVEGLNYMLGNVPAIKPSPQQEAVWEQLANSDGAKNIAFVAFNRSIAMELQRRVPKGCQAMTMHSMGFKAITNALGTFEVDAFVSGEHVAKILGDDLRNVRKRDFEMLRMVDRLVSLCKMNLAGMLPNGGLLEADDPSWHEQLDELTSHHDLELNGLRTRVYDLVPQVLHSSLDTVNAVCISYDDMIWLPVVLNLTMPKFDLLLVDECQDLNRCQQELAFRAGKRLVFCGDVHQAIYGFAGADSKSMERLAERLGASERGCVTLPLTVTRRCGLAIVAEAQKIVPDFEAHESNSDGSIKRMAFKSDDGNHYAPYAQPGDMCLCRVNAPLVSECFRMIKNGVRAEVQGRDIGKGLVTLVKRMKADDINDLISKITDWQYREVDREMQKRKPSENRMITVNDKADCILVFAKSCDTLDEVIDRINEMFTDREDNRAVRYSSIHKAKGLESGRVFLLEPQMATVPHPMAKSAWQIEQEWNLRYVAITRAIDELVYVR